jgi:mannose-6-phosphate isomerase
VTSLRPHVLPPNRPRRFYRAGTEIDEFRGVASTTNCPEDWIASTVEAWDEAGVGLTVVDGVLLRDRIADDPVGWLGSEHVERFGPDPSLLVKLLNPGQRLAIHCHPDDRFAIDHLVGRTGKTEAWIVLSAPPSATVNLGFRDSIRLDTLAAWARAGEPAPFLASTNEIHVKAGDTLLVPAGVPHGIGRGVFIAELQQAADLSVLLEWQNFAQDNSFPIGLPLDAAIECVDRTAWTLERLSALRGNVPDEGGTCLPVVADRFFRADLLMGGRGPVSLEPAFSVLIVTDGRGTLRTDSDVLEVARGTTVVVPHAAGRAAVHGDVTFLRCRPPALADAA